MGDLAYVSRCCWCCYFAPGRVRSIAISVSVCLSVRSHISKTTCPNFTKFSVRVTYGRGSVLFLRQCNKLCASSGFVDDVIFSHNGANIDRPTGHWWLARWRQGWNMLSTIVLLVVMMMMMMMMICRSRRAEAKIQQMLWKINYGDFVFSNTANNSSVIYELLVYLSIQHRHTVVIEQLALLEFR